MTRRLLGFAIGSLILYGTSAIHAEMMYGPAIVGSAPANASVEVYADNGDGLFDGLDSLIQTVTTSASGDFSVSDLDMALKYFVSSGDAVSELTTIGDIQRMIDSFEITQTASSNPLTGSRVSTAEGPESEILGGLRHFYVELLSGTAEAQLRSNPFSQNSNLQIDMDAGSVGMIEVGWPSLSQHADFTGAGAFGGITLGAAVDLAGEGQLLTLAMQSPAGMSFADLNIQYDPNVNPENQTHFIQWSDFIGDATPTNVTEFKLMIGETKESLDAQINMIGLTGPTVVSLVPEPTGAMSFLFATLLLYAQRRRRQR